MKLCTAVAIFLSAILALSVVVAVLLFQLYWGVLTPIHFYGRVMDTDGRPVPIAEVYVSFAAFPYSPGIRADTMADESGNFSVWGHGAGIVIMTSKSGYYNLPESSGNFSTWPPGNNETWPQNAGDYWHSSASHPIIFKLRKRGSCEPLIEHGGEFGLNIKVAGDGMPVSLDLTEGRAYQLTNEDLKVQAWINDGSISPGSGKHFDWRFLISVPGGGLQARKGEFDFEAPQTGYLSSDDIRMSACDPKWDSSATREYFLKLATGKYARVKIVMAVGGNNGFTIASYLNPALGHKNLEYDPKLDISK